MAQETKYYDDELLKIMKDYNLNFNEIYSTKHVVGKLAKLKGLAYKCSYPIKVYFKYFYLSPQHHGLPTGSNLKSYKQTTFYITNTAMNEKKMIDKTAIIFGYKNRKEFLKEWDGVTVICY